MEESTTSNLAKVLKNIDTAQEMEQYMELPEVMNSCQTFPEYFRSLPAVQEMDTGELIRSSGLERSYYYQVMKGTRSPGRDKVLRLCLAAGRIHILDSPLFRNFPPLTWRSAGSRPRVRSKRQRAQTARPGPPWTSGDACLRRGGGG